MFSSQFLAILVYGALACCALSSIALLLMLARDLMKGETW
jgi:hypothetical protein